MSSDRPRGAEGAIQSGSWRTPIVRILTAFAALQFVPAATAHAGTTHAGTPHWLLLAVLALGIVLVAAGLSTLRRRTTSRRTATIGLFAGLGMATFRAIGLVEIQLEATADPSRTLLALHPIASYFVGVGVVVGSQVLTLRYWPDRPRYSVLGAVLGAWILYPVLLPDGVTHPFGYALVLALPMTLGYVLTQDASDVLGSVVADRFSRTVAIASGAVVWVFLSVSAGTLTVVPETSGVPDGPFLVGIGVADPLVVWPAVEFYLPSVPLFGMLSVGTIVLFGTLSSLVGLNVALVADELRHREGDLSSGALAGTVCTTGATACGCCAPALYGVLSAGLGASATPIYWSFMDTSSPLSGAFLTASVLLLTASLVRSGHDLGGRTRGEIGGPDGGPEPARRYR